MILELMRVMMQASTTSPGRQLSNVAIQATGTTTSLWVPLATLGAAVIAACAAFTAAVLQHRSTREISLAAGLRADSEALSVIQNPM